MCVNTVKTNTFKLYTQLNAFCISRVKSPAFHILVLAGYVH